MRRSPPSTAWGSHRQSLHPQGLCQVYVATTHDAVTPELVAMLLKGVKLHDKPAPLAAVICRMLNTQQLEIVLEQGKYHQVKFMLAAAGNHCTALQRSEIGGLKLDGPGLAEGEWIYLNEGDRALLAAG